MAPYRPCFMRSAESGTGKIVLEHNGSIGSLEEWFDERRLNDDFVATGFRGPYKTRAVRGHPFGLKLDADDRKALIAFLRTL